MYVKFTITEMHPYNRVSLPGFWDPHWGRDHIYGGSQWVTKSKTPNERKKALHIRSQSLLTLKCERITHHKLRNF